MIEETSKIDGMFTTVVEEVETLPLTLIGVTVKLTLIDPVFATNNWFSPLPLLLGKPTTNLLPTLDKVTSI